MKWCFCPYVKCADLDHLQSYQGLCSTLIHSLMSSYFSKDPDQTVRMHSLIWVFAAQYAQRYFSN